MSIKAEMIEQWSDGHEARAELPVLVRRLIGHPAGTTALAIPGGAAVGRPGFDGIIEGAIGNAWVPAESSRWEIGSGTSPGDKANYDYGKRTAATDSKLRARAAFVFVTPRRWAGKTAWADRIAREGKWREIRAYDATDLEHWLEQETATSLWFAEQLGISGHGVHPPEVWWRQWAEQTRPAITSDALFAARDAARSELASQLANCPTLIGVRADSAEEAAAFVCAVVLASEIKDTVVVSEPGGWRFVDSNPGIAVAIAASPEIASLRSPRLGQTLVVPLGISDAATQTRGAAASVQEIAISLNRPHKHEFVDALMSMGVEPSDAERSSLASGRSWPVYRRLQAANRAVALPHWLDKPSIEALAIVCLVGSWSVNRPGDISIIKAIGGRPYEEIERDLRAFATIDDAPVISIGSLWKARSPLELLHLVGPRITTAELDRFFEIALVVLAKPDPALALDSDKRWAANIYGAARGESGLVLDALCDGLVRLAVVGTRIDRLNSEDLPGRVARLVHQLLADADAERWYSLSNVLPDFAEAAPDTFLRAVESGMLRQDGGPLSLLRATGPDGSPVGACHHSGLLWALERLAWDPVQLPRVANLLAKMSGEPIKGNWANSPYDTLNSLFRPWWPQTTANDTQRLKVIDRLREAAANTAWRLMLDCVNPHLGAASDNAHPNWRDNNAGAPSPGIYFRAYAYAIVLRVISDADGRVDRIIRLLEQLHNFASRESEQILDLAAVLKTPDEDERERLSDALRGCLMLEVRINRNAEQRQPHIARVRLLLASLATDDPVAASRWLFQKTWLEVPPEDGEDEDDWQARSERVERLRAEALAMIVRRRGLNGIDELSKSVAEIGLVGWTLVHVDQRSSQQMLSELR